MECKLHLPPCVERTPWNHGGTKVKHISLVYKLDDAAILKMTNHYRLSEPSRRCLCCQHINHRSNQKAPCRATARGSRTPYCCMENGTLITIISRGMPPTGTWGSAPYWQSGMYQKLGGGEAWWSNGLWCTEVSPLPGPKSELLWPL